ncbi:pyocin knob domain-containing protein [Flavobacterium sp. SORGH_AS_0622]|uniref:pyocin knob domain-containing protein n=1 Tax=Flavobacterium sp. SORGH_AS_0622 TaxID=3041772 RepID=UPI002781D312|nr:pyocin knob domain-containing protein [Flavobacterium sp. SORGH_AS_0622]MDQ1165902.1 hypothetical protein [Flavobacterium sp. SORGH_AS_0622]
MAQKHINTSTPNDNLGDTLRDANIKCEDNFTELYANKVDKISGKGLSTNDYTTADKTKLAGIPSDAEKNVQADFLVNDPDSDAYIKNKPNLITLINWGDIQGDIANQYDLQNALDQKPGFDYVDDKITQSVNANTYDFAPSEDAVYNALTLKEDIANKNNANGYAGLDSSGKLFSSQLPALAISETFVVASQGAMLAISGAESGDIAVRTDINKTFILKQSPASTLANWQELLTPTDAVTSVFGRTGAVVANAGDYTTALVTETTNKRYQTDVQAARNDATSSIQTQLDSKALDSNVIHKTGDESVAGVKTYLNTQVLNTGAQIGMQITTTNHRGILVNVGGSNTAIDGTSVGLIGVAGRSTNSTGVLAQTTNGVYIAEFYGGGSRQAYVSSAGDVLAKNFVKSGGTSTQYLMADGSVSTLTNPITGSGTVGVLPKFTGNSALGNSLLRDSGAVVTIESTGDQVPLRIVSTLGADESSIGFQSLSGTNSYHVRIGAKKEDLTFTTGNNERMRILENGSIGVGINPTAKFDVNLGNGAVLKFIGSGSQGEIVSTDVSNSDYKDLSLNGKTIVFKTDNGAQKAVIDINGNVGIGINPLAKLDVYQNNNTTALLVKNSVSSFYAGNDADGAYIGGYRTDNVNFVPLQLQKHGGYVGIGTGTPTERLDVVGNIKASGNLKAGSIEYGTGINIGGTNLNSLSRGGFFIGSALTNAPNAEWWYVTCEIHDGGGYIKQTITSYGGGANPIPAGTTYIRNYFDGGAWTAWQKVSFDGQGVESGTYTPIITSGSNCSSFTLGTATYMKIGNVVNVTVSVTYTTTAPNTATNFTVSTPFNKTSTSNYYCGTANISLSTIQTIGKVYFLGSNGNVRCEYTSGAGSGNPTYATLQFQYSTTH